MSNKKIIVNNMNEFKKKIKLFGYNGRPIINENFSKPFIKFLRKNPNAPLPSGYIFYNNKPVLRKTLEDKRSKNNKLKPSVIKKLVSNNLDKFKKLSKKINKKINIINNPNMGSTTFINDDLNIFFLNDEGRDEVSLELSDLKKEARKKGYKPNDKAFIKLIGITSTSIITGENTTSTISKEFTMPIRGMKLKEINRDFEDYYNSWIENNNISGSLSSTIIQRIELIITKINQNVGVGKGAKETCIKIDGIKIKDFNSQGKNNCFFWCVRDWILDKFIATRLTPNLCNTIRKRFKIEKDKKISCEECIEICKVLFKKNIYIINRYDRDEKEIVESINYDRTLFIMNNHIYLYEGEYKSKYCEKCKTNYFNEHNIKSCQRRECFIKKKRLVLPNKRLEKKVSNQKLVLHYDIESHTDNEDHHHDAYIIGFTHYDFNKNKWIYGEFEGVDCMKSFYNYIRIVPKIKFLNAYNGSRFDTYFLAKEVLKENIKNNTICVNGSSILKMTIKKLIEPKIIKTTKYSYTELKLNRWVSKEEYSQLKQKNKIETIIETEEYPELITCDLCRHLDGSLKDNLIGNKCKISKGEIDHNISTFWENTDNQRKAEVREYLKCDVLGLRELYEKFDNNGFENYKINLCDYLTGSQLCYDIWRTLFLGDAIVELPNAEDDIRFRKSIYGGRCYLNKRTFISDCYQLIIDGKIKFEDIEDYLIDGDIVSLYPFVMTWLYPVGHHNKTDVYIDGKMGIYEVEFISNKKILIPPIPRRVKGGGLKWDLLDGEGSYTSVDIERAMSVGYTFKIKGGVYWNETAPIFKSYMEEFYKKKKEATKGTPAYSTAKRNMNALYGKMIQKPIYDEKINCRNHQDLLNVFLKGQVTNIMELTKDNWLVSYEPIIIEDYDKKVNKPSHLGAFILAYSRTVMWDAFISSGGLTDMNKLFYYTDTDSIQIHQRDTKKFNWGKNLGCMSNDLGDDCKIIKAIWIQPKLYMLEYIDSNMEIHRHYRGAGCPMKQLHLGLYEDLISGKKVKVKPDFQIKKNLYNQKNRRYNNGIIENCSTEFFTHYHHNNNDINSDGSLVLEKVLGTQVWNGRIFKSHLESYPNGYGL